MSRSRDDVRQLQFAPHQRSASSTRHAACVADARAVVWRIRSSISTTTSGGLSMSSSFPNVRASFSTTNAVGRGMPEGSTSPHGNRPSTGSRQCQERSAVAPPPNACA